MRRIISFLILVSAFICVIAQSKGPEFPGGEENLQQFLKENVLYPYSMNSRKTYNVKAEVLVAKDGTVTFFEILSPKKPKREIIYETKRVIKMMPKWNPGGHYADDGTFVPEQWKTVVNICFNPMDDNHEEMTCIDVKKAGTLESLLTQEQKDTCSQLRIIGQINSADIITLRNMAGENGCLEKLDLSGVSIVASKDPYLQIEDAEKEIMLWAYSVRKKSVNFPGDKRFFYEREVNKNRGWGTPYQNKLYPSSQGRYLSPSPYQVPYRERAYSGGYDDPYYIMGKSNEPSSNKRTGICLFEDNLNRVKHGEFIPMRPIRFKGHRLKRKGYSYILSAYTEKDSFCPDMFYRCPKLKQVILPIKASVNERVSVAGSNIEFTDQ